MVVNKEESRVEGLKVSMLMNWVESSSGSESCSSVLLGSFGTAANGTRFLCVYMKVLFVLFCLFVYVWVMCVGL